METSNAYSDYFNAVKGCSEAAQLDFAKIWALIDLNKPDEARDLLLELLPPLVDQYGEAAATAAAEMYEAVMMAEKGIYKAADIADTYGSKIEKSVRYAAGFIFNDEKEKSFSTLSLALDYYLKQPARDTVFNNCKRDRNLGARYARVPQGETTCDFCIMLASRGFVYRTKNSAGDMGNDYHHSCDCLPVVSFVDNPSVPGYDPDYYYEQYKKMLDDGKEW